MFKKTAERGKKEKIFHDIKKIGFRRKHGPSEQRKGKELSQMLQKEPRPGKARRSNPSGFVEV